MKKKQNTFWSTGNNRGDFIEVEELGEGILHIRIGHRCVTTLDEIVPIEFLTAILSQTMLQNNNDVLKIIDGFTWSAEFKEVLKNKVGKVE